MSGTEESADTIIICFKKIVLKTHFIRSPRSKFLQLFFILKFFYINLERGSQIPPFHSAPIVALFGSYAIWLFRKS